MKIACCIFSHNITKGMKSVGPIGTLKKNSKSKSLIIMQIEYLRKIFQHVDIYVISGFGQEKLNQALQNKKTVNTIINQEYSSKNYGYALKLLLNSLASSNKNYKGLFLLDANIVLRSLKFKNKDISWVLTKKYNRTKEKKDYLGVNTDNFDRISHIFYNTGDKTWCKSFYLTQKDLNIMIANKDSYHDNMFMFEIINDLIDNHNIKIYTNTVKSSSHISEISGIKDKNKIK